MTRKARMSDRPALDLIEDAVHLLRTAPAATLAVYALGALPFVLGFLFFWSDMSRSAFAAERLEPLAAVLTLLFVWLQLCQNAFARRLWAQRAGIELARRPWRESLALNARQLFWQATALVVLPVAAATWLALTWCLPFYQSLTALNGAITDPERSPVARAWRHACRSPWQNFILLKILLLAALVVFLNLVIVFFTVPHLLKTLFGFESAITQSPLAMLNTTFFAAAGALTWLCLDPVLKAVYVVRCFEAESITTGDDLRADLRAAARRRAAMTLGAIAALLLSLPTAGAAAESTATEDRSPDTVTPQPAAAAPAELDAAIDDVLRRREYAWRMPREALPVKTAEADTWLQRAMERILNWIAEAGKSVGRFVMEFLRWVFDKLFGRQGPALSAGTGWTDAVRGLFILLLIGLAAAIAWFAYRLWRNHRNRVREVLAPAAAAAPNLADDSLTASQLPEDEWLRLAREMMGKGEFRLALRAFYLAGLAHLAARELVTIARYKSNVDYSRELGRRGHALPAVMSAFASNVAVFDRVWYGRHEATPELLNEFEGNLRTIAAA